MSANPHLLQWHQMPNAQTPKGIALVMHGLNQKPEKMQAIIDVLTTAGIEVFGCSLSGHGRNYTVQDGLSEDEARLETFRRVTYEQWMDETYAAYQAAGARRDEIGDAPLFLVGYSIGALIACNLLVSRQDVHFDKMMLFAPALKIRRYTHLLRLFSGFPGLIIPSAAPQEYRTNRGTSMAAYNVIYRGVRIIAQAPGKRLNVPTLIFMDRKDELVSYSRLQNMIHQKALSQWQLCSVEKDTAVGKQYHHLVIDPAAVGATCWQQITTHILRHLELRPISELIG